MICHVFLCIMYINSYNLQKSIYHKIIFYRQVKHFLCKTLYKGRRLTNTKIQPLWTYTRTPYLWAPPKDWVWETDLSSVEIDEVTIPTCLAIDRKIASHRKIFHLYKTPTRQTWDLIPSGLGMPLPPNHPTTDGSQVKPFL
jgi:hypothetical protein